MDSDSLDILEDISCYGAQEFTLHGPKPPYPSYIIICTLPYSDTEFGDTIHLPGHFLLTYGDEFTSHGSILKDSTSQFLWFTSHGSNSQETLFSHQCTSIEQIHVLPKRKIPPDIIHLATVYVLDQVEHILFFQRGIFLQT